MTEPFFNALSLQESDQKRNTLVISGTELTNLRLDTVQKHIRILVGDELFPIQQNVASLLLIYCFHVRYSDERHFFCLPVQTFTAKLRALSRLTLWLVSRKFFSDRSFRRSVTLWNRLPRTCFLDHNHLKLFKSTVNRHLSYICKSYSLFVHSY